MKEFKAPVYEVIYLNQSDVISTSTCVCVDCSVCPPGKNDCTCFDFSYDPTNSQT